MMENNYIPVQNKGLYYIYDVLNSSLYPCSKAVYTLFVDNSYQQLMQAVSQGDACGELASFMKLLQQCSNKDKYKYKLFSYPSFSRKDVELSLAKTPHIVLELTRKCNLACVYCCYGKLYKKVGSARKKGGVDSVVSFLRLLLSLRVSYHVMSDFRISFYGGEPLLCMKEIKECVMLAQQMMSHVKISFCVVMLGLTNVNVNNYLV